MTNANAVDAPALVPQKKCHQCHQMKDHSAFYRDKSKPTGRTSRCKECKESVAKTYAVTGKVRGLLCRACNRSIGQLCHDPEILRRAAEYLEKP